MRFPRCGCGADCGIPVVYEVRALWEDAAVDHGTTREGSLRYGASRALETFALRHADHVTTICEGLRDEIAARGIPKDRITVIPNAVDVAQFRIGGAARSGAASPAGTGRQDRHRVRRLLLRLRRPGSADRGDGAARPDPEEPAPSARRRRPPGSEPEGDGRRAGNRRPRDLRRPRPARSRSSAITISSTCSPILGTGCG